MTRNTFKNLLEISDHWVYKNQWIVLTLWVNASKIFNKFCNDDNLGSRKLFSASNPRPSPPPASLPGPNIDFRGRAPSWFGPCALGPGSHPVWPFLLSRTLSNLRAMGLWSFKTTAEVKLCVAGATIFFLSKFTTFWQLQWKIWYRVHHSVTTISATLVHDDNDYIVLVNI